MPQVKIGLGPIARYKTFTVLSWVQKTRIYIQIRIILAPVRYRNTFCLQYGTNAGSGDSFSDPR